MIRLVFLALFVAVAAASYGPAHVAHVEEHHAVIPGGKSSQYHSQSDHGDYSYGYSDPNSRKHEEGDYGAVRGSYSYIAPDGTPIVNEYYADANGFHSNLAPTAPYDVHPQPDYAPAYAHGAVYGHAAAYAPAVAHYSSHHVAHAAPAVHHASHTVAHAAHGGAHHATHTAHGATHTVAHASPAGAYHETHAASHAAPVVAHHASHHVAHAAPAHYGLGYGYNGYAHAGAYAHAGTYAPYGIY